jgi:hypothetical protein
VLSSGIKWSMLFGHRETVVVNVNKNENKRRKKF